jgi:hypothetical protein
MGGGHGRTLPLCLVREDQKGEEDLELEDSRKKPELPNT